MLNRSIGKWDLVLLMINSVIGAGIFGLPSKVFKLSGVYSIAALFACAVVVFIIILCFAEVSSRFNKTGGPYVYTLEAFGRFPAFLMGWLILLSRIVTFAALIKLLVIYLSYFSPFFADDNVKIITTLFIIATLAWINHIGVKNTTRVNNILTVAKMLPLLLFIIIGLFHVQPELLTPVSKPSFSDFSASVFLLVFAFTGFESAVVSSGEIKEPRKTLPFALLVSALIIAVFYALIQIVSIGTLPGLANSEKPLAEAAHLFMGSTGGNLIALGAIISVTGTLNAIMLIGSRVPFALSQEKQFPVFFSTLHSRYLTPTRSLILFATLTAIVSISGSFISSVTISTISKVIILLVVCATLIRLRMKAGTTKDYFKLRYGFILATISILLSIWLLTSTKMKEIRDVSIVLLAGAVIYGLYQLFKKKK
jgi:basic amino acid/polyamine antiporter, APA family